MINCGKNGDWKQNIKHGKVGVTADFGKKKSGVDGEIIKKALLNELR